MNSCAYIYINVILIKSFRFLSDYTFFGAYGNSTFSIQNNINNTCLLLLDKCSQEDLKLLFPRIIYRMDLLYVLSFMLKDPVRILTQCLQITSKSKYILVNIYFHRKFLKSILFLNII